MILNLDKPSDVVKANNVLSELISNKKVVEIKEVKHRRSYSQNRYLHLALRIFSLETGYTAEESKQIYKRMNRKIYSYTKDGSYFVRSSSDLDSKDMSDSIDKFRDFCSSELGLYIPEPKDVQALEAIEYGLKNKGL